MKIGVISDLHVDYNANRSDRPFADILLDLIDQRGLHMLIIAGDISNKVEQSLAFLEYVQAHSRIPVLFVPGNHDFWDEKNQHTDAWGILELFRQNPGCIVNQPYEINDDWVIIGHTGWYDHSFGSSDFNEETFNKMHYADRTWKDSQYVNWGMSNKEVHQIFLEDLMQQLTKYSNKKVIFITHMVSDERFTVPLPHELWNYFNAFLGSNEYSELFDSFPSIKYGVMGHVHYRKKEKRNNAQLICACLGYHSEWEGSLEEELVNTLEIIEI